MPSLEGTEYRPVELDGFWFGLHRLYLQKNLSSPAGTSRSQLGRFRLGAGYQLGSMEMEWTAYFLVDRISLLQSFKDERMDWLVEAIRCQLCLTQEFDSLPVHRRSILVRRGAATCQGKEQTSPETIARI
jgi:hypothetical protein